jgi:hypothetical protein
VTDQVSWERQKGESQQAFQAFVAYRDMGSDRSAAKVGRRLGRPVGTWGAGASGTAGTNAPGRGTTSRNGSDASARPSPSAR